MFHSYWKKNTQRDFGWRLKLSPHLVHLCTLLPNTGWWHSNPAASPRMTGWESRVSISNGTHWHPILFKKKITLRFGREVGVPLDFFWDCWSWMCLISLNYPLYAHRKISAPHGERWQNSDEFLPSTGNIPPIYGSLMIFMGVSGVSQGPTLPPRQTDCSLGPAGWRRERRKWAKIVGCPQLKQSGRKKVTDGCVYMDGCIYIYIIVCVIWDRWSTIYIAMEYYLDYSNA